MSISLLYPVPPNAPISQTFAEHVAHGNPRYFGGIDWAVPTGTPIRAAADGKVIKASADNTGYGNHIRVQHADGYMTLYGHLQDYAVGVGAIVKAGDVIGRSNNTGNSTGPHLHFELRHNNMPIDPAPYFLAIEPEPQPEPGPDSDALQFVTTVALNLRSAPGGGILSIMPAGTTITVTKLSGALWVQTTGGWCCLGNDQGLYLRQVEP